MLVIRMQRTGRKGHAMFRVVVQDSRRTPTSGKVVAWLGSYDPHSKAINLNKEKAQYYLDHGAQPSERVAVVLRAEGIKLPTWVNLSSTKTGTVRNADKRRSTRPAEPEPEEALAPEVEAEASEAAAPEAAPATTPESESAPAETAKSTETSEPAGETTEEAKES